MINKILMVGVLDVQRCAKICEAMGGECGSL